jgi:hypothetical protein
LTMRFWIVAILAGVVLALWSAFCRHRGWGPWAEGLGAFVIVPIAMISIRSLRYKGAPKIR